MSWHGFNSFSILCVINVTKPPQNLSFNNSRRSLGHYGSWRFPYQIHMDENVRKDELSRRSDNAWKPRRQASRIAEKHITFAIMYAQLETISTVLLTLGDTNVWDAPASIALVSRHSCSGCIGTLAVVLRYQLSLE